MNVSVRKRGRGAVASIAALALGTLGAITLSTSAYAAPEFGNIVDQPGSIIIHKHLHQNGTSVVGDPDGGTTIPSDGVVDVEFTAYPLLNADGSEVDLTDPDAWEGLDTLTPGAGACEAPAGYQLGTALTPVTTGTSGEATIPVSEIGLFLVCETDAPADIVDRAAPFIVTVPYPNSDAAGDDDGWLYNVHVYPKNGKTDVDKTIDPQVDLGLGSVISFPVTVGVPTLGSGNALSSFIIADTLDDRLGDVTVGSVTLGGTAVDSSYYSVEVDPSNANNIAVVFNSAGLTWLGTQGGQSVVVKFEGEVISLGDGEIKNIGRVFVNDPNPDLDWTTDPGTPTPEVKTNWGNVKILKTDATSEEETLAGAVFEVYPAATPYPAAGDTCTAEIAAGASPLEVLVGGSPATQFTSDASGVVTIPGLFVSDSENAPINAATRCYVVKEVQAPAGYVTPTGTAADTAVTVAIGQTAVDTYDAAIKNSQQGVPNLPLTGAAGQILMVAAGALLLVGGFTAYTVTRRRRAGAEV